MQIFPPTSFRTGFSTKDPLNEMNTMKIFLLLLSLLVGVSALSFSTDTVDGNGFADLVFKNRLFVPYGPDLTIDPPQSSDEVWEGYGFGMGAVEHFAYDPYQGYVYTQSEGGPYVAVIDYHKFPAIVTNLSLDLSELDSDIKDVAVCGKQGLLFVAATDADIVRMYETVKRNEMAAPSLLFEINAGKKPDNLRVNKDCTVLAVANENDGDALAEGAIHLVSDFRSNGGPTVRKITFDSFSDDYLLQRNVHMPLTEKAMEYWDDFSNLRDDIDWAPLRQDYNPGRFMQPEFTRFSEDGSELYVNLQKNSALVRINVESAEAKSISGYGLKPWTTGTGVDIIDDGGCDLLVTNEALYSLPAPDGFDVATIDGVTYILTANEGSDFDLGEYEEKTKAGELFNGLVLGQRNFVASPSLFNNASSATGSSAPFNSACEDNDLDWCASDIEITMGSAAVNYANASAPVVERVVLFGGRGISIFKVPEDIETELDLVWDSGSSFETEGCSAFPWSHNGVQDEDFSPVGGAYYELNPDDQDDLDDMNDPIIDGCANAGDGSPGACPISETIDWKAPEDGLAPESVTVAVACNRLLAVSCGENNGDCFLYDITNLNSGADPVLKKVFNLSPASEIKSPGVAYDDKSLGDLDAEVVLFVPPEESPTGKAAFIFGGAHSGTLSFWEFECNTEIAAVETVFVGEQNEEEQDTPVVSSSSDSEQGLSSGAKAGIAIGVIAGAIVVAVVGVKLHNKHASSNKGVEFVSGKAAETNGNGVA